MSALVVVAHPDPGSLTHHVGQEIHAALVRAGIDTDVADLHAEGFDPRFTLADRQRYRSAGAVPADVVAEQQRLDTVDDLVLVFPVFWWSMPALLKGWVDRVFIRGWAFDDTTSPMTPKLGRLTIHLVMLAGEDAEGFRRRGYDTAITTQLVTGVLGYCGARTGVTAIIHESESRTPASTDLEARSTAASIVESARQRELSTPGGKRVNNTRVTLHKCAHSCG